MEFWFGFAWGVGTVVAVLVIALAAFVAHAWRVYGSDEEDETGKG
jgi:hypothetical protein